MFSQAGYVAKEQQHAGPQNRRMIELYKELHEVHPGVVTEILILHSLNQRT